MPSIEDKLVEPDQMLTAFVKNTPDILHLVLRYTVMFAIKLIDATFSNDSFPSRKKKFEKTLIISK